MRMDGRDEGDEKGRIPAGGGYEDATEEGAFEVTPPREAPAPGTAGGVARGLRGLRPEGARYGA